jgi:hypothetical protein
LPLPTVAIAAAHPAARPEILALRRGTAVGHYMGDPPHVIRRVSVFPNSIPLLAGSFLAASSQASARQQREQKVTANYHPTVGLGTTSTPATQTFPLEDMGCIPSRGGGGVRVVEAQPSRPSSAPSSPRTQQLAREARSRSPPPAGSSRGKAARGRKQHLSRSPERLTFASARRRVRDGGMRCA